MGFIDRIKKAFSRDKTIELEKQGKGYTAGDPYGASYDLMTSQMGLRNIKAALSMDQGLMARYADYEGMDDYPELSGALNIFADDTTITDNLRGKSIWGESKDILIKDVIDDLLQRRLRIEDDIWLIVRTLCKYGNAYQELIVSKDGVTGWKPLPVPTMRRIVSPRGDLIGFVQDLMGRFELKQFETVNDLKEQCKEKGMVFFEPWEVIHWRLRSKNVESIYGYSVLEPSRWIWKRLVMLEDTSLLFMLTRSPGRYAFYIDTGDLPMDQAMAEVKRVRRNYKKRTLVNPSTGELEFRMNVFSPEDDIFVPTGKEKNTRVETLSGPEWNSMEGIEYFRDKLFTSITIPKSYFGGEASADRAVAQSDVRFARTCMRIQRAFRNGVREAIRIHMAAINIDPDTVEWDTRMTMPSSIFELQQIEVLNSQAGLIETLSQFLPKEWLFQRVMHLSQEDALSVSNDKTSEDEKTAMDQARISATIQDRYPGVVTGNINVDQDGQPPAAEGVSKELIALRGLIEQILVKQKSTAKRLDEVYAGIGKENRRIYGNVRKIRSVK